eukprot:Phypoly_transcript_16597.p1 GENE.Phypoly_transcript_16597~~Phypoly_transcript_16597.p1  ORF type:complete len:102 (-),score=9.31 Phypoly_transcript_16597:263-568(-)
MSSEWSNGVCSCGDGANCPYAFFCTPCAFASARSEFDGSNCCFNLLCMTGPAVYNVIREGYGIEGDCCTDMLLVGCFPCCAAMRLNSEIRLRGPRKVGMSR